MKIEVEIYEDQLEFLKRIKELPALVESHIGKVPQSWPGSTAEFGRIKEMCESLEFKWKRWVFDTVCCNAQVKNLFEDTELVKSSDYASYQDLI